DPSGRSYQIVQSLIAVANGGLLGRGPGLGAPGFVPVAQSDFIFAAISEETGLAGALALVLLLALLVHRGLRLALETQDDFARLLALGISTYFAAQSVLIIGGNLRLLPLTGVTLPFVSYGGSSLVTSFLTILVLLHLTTDRGQQNTASRPHSAVHRFPSLAIAASLLAALAAIALVTGWWAVVRGPALLGRNDNPRRALADRIVPRGAILDRHNTPLVVTEGAPGEYTRRTLVAALGPVLGYIHPVYGLAGLEDSLDDYLRGLAGNPPLTVWWHHLLYGQPPPGVDIRLTLDLDLQTVADDLLAGQRGALVLLDTANGDVLVMSSHPAYDPNRLDDIWDELIAAEDAPLLNRAVQGRYPVGDLWERLAPGIEPLSWGQTPEVRLPGGEPHTLAEMVSPLDMALVAAALGNQGERPAPRLVQAYRHPQEGWVLFAPRGSTGTLEGLISPLILARGDSQTWGLAIIPQGEELTWYLGGTLSGAEESYALALALEQPNLGLAEYIGEQVLRAALEK
ncbi:MAG: hypothetical protein D6803_05915, partial [Anaerolineae bacterium]